MVVSNQLFGTHPNGDILTNYYPNAYYLPGLATYKIGSETGLTTGSVLEVGATITDGFTGIAYTNQVRVSNLQESGDSGGTVYCMYGMSQANLVPPKTIVGIATVRRDSDGSAYTSPVWSIMNAFNIEPCLYPLQYSYVQGVVGAASQYGSGRVDDHSDLRGKFPDGESARILGIWVNGDGGNIVGYVNKVSTGTVAIFARSVTSSTKIHVYTSSSSSGPWTEITSNKWVSQNSNMDWIVCGSRGVSFEYIAISAMQEDNKPANIYIDTVIVY